MGLICGSAVALGQRPAARCDWGLDGMKLLSPSRGTRAVGSIKFQQITQPVLLDPTHSPTSSHSHPIQVCFPPPACTLKEPPLPARVMANAKSPLCYARVGGENREGILVTTGPEFANFPIGHPHRGEEESWLVFYELLLTHRTHYGPLMGFGGVC